MTGDRADAATTHGRAARDLQLPHREGGSILTLAMAVLAAMTLTTVIAARHVHRAGHRARWTHLRAVARNLAEAGIVAGRARKAVPTGLVGDALPAVAASVRVARRQLGGGRHQLTSKAELRARSGEVMRYVIEAVVQLAPGRAEQLVGWTESRR